VAVVGVRRRARAPATGRLSGTSSEASAISVAGGRLSLSGKTQESHGRSAVPNRADVASGATPKHVHRAARGLHAFSLREYPSPRPPRQWGHKRYPLQNSYPLGKPRRARAECVRGRPSRLRGKPRDIAFVFNAVYSSNGCVNCLRSQPGQIIKGSFSATMKKPLPRLEIQKSLERIGMQPL
jgi:hypothetical protein